MPGLFEGQTAATVEEGTAWKDKIGKEELLRRAVPAAAPYWERGPVYAGSSLGGPRAPRPAR